MPNHTRLTLGELLAHDNTTVQRNAMSILKTLQRVKFCRHGVLVGNGLQPCRECVHNERNKPYLERSKQINTVTPHGQ